jgi:uncharacterized repeat protein (TIGR03803 family)
MRNLYIIVLFVLFNPSTSLAQPELWSMSPRGGANGTGCIYKSSADGSNISVQYSFPVTGFWGANPMYCSPMQASNGLLYGVMSGGGLHNAGVLYSYNTTTGTFTSLYSFKGLSDGGVPMGDLMQASDGNLYGMTSDGGNAIDNGVLFRYEISSGTYTVLHTFSSATGTNPFGGLVQASNGLLYGMTNLGGNFSQGVIFSYDIANDTLIKILNLDATSGGKPYAGFIKAANGKLYATTTQGGVNNLGTLIQFDPATNVLTKRYDFTTANGYFSYGKLYQHSSGLFYGLTRLGGTNSDGVLFRFDDATATYSVRFTFNNSDAAVGGYPYSNLALGTDGKLYGTTEQTGSGSANGTIFNFDISTSAYTRVRTFSGISSGTGAEPRSGLWAASNGKIYGTCSTGGSGDHGTFWNYEPSTTIFTYHSLRFLPSGARPNGQLMKAANGLLYGMTLEGGSNRSGVIFSFNPTSSTYTVLHDFALGTKANGGLLQASNGILYGLTEAGGSSGLGSLFSYNISTNTHTVLVNLSNALGALPAGNLIQASDGKLYGMTAYGGANSSGVIFSYNISTSTYSKLADFNATTSGQRPYGSLVQANNGSLYGMNSTGSGAYSDGALFKFNPVTNVLTPLVAFSGSNGSGCRGSMIKAPDGMLYGMTAYAGTLAGGVIFKVDPTTDTYTKLYDMNSLQSGFSGFGDLLLASDNSLYGVTYLGSPGGFGSMFRYNLSTSTFTKLRDWSAPDPASHVYAKFLEELITITTSSVSPSVCAGATMLVPYTVSGMMDTSNVFTAELSNASGSFASPVVIGTKVSSSSGQDTIVAVIPSGTTPGNAYRVRVVASSPSVTGSVTPTIIQVQRTDQQLFLEQIGSVGATTAIATHEAANGFDNDAFTMTGTADIRNTSPSSGYSGSSGGANVFITNSSGRNFQIEGINTAPYSDMQISFGIFRNGILFNNDAPVVEVSANGSTYTTLSYASIPTGFGTGTWHFRTASGNIPSTTNLRIRFRQAEAVPTNQYRIDDVRLTFSTPTPTITAVLPWTICNGSSLTLSAAPVAAYNWSTGATTSSISVSAAGNYTCVLTGYNGCTLTSNVIAVTDTTPDLFSVTGGGTVCSPPAPSGVAIGLSGSEAGVYYQLYLNGSTPIGSPVMGNGNSFSFGNQTGTGTYTVIASSAGGSCTRSMTGSAVISSVPGTLYYADSDGDGYGNPLDTLRYCTLPSGYVANALDCNDNNNQVSPAALEVCNGIDDDCDLYIDEGCGPEIYCIGPSASYTPPSGPSYVNQFSPFPTLTAALFALSSMPATVHRIFEIQNNYTPTGESFPLQVMYPGTPTATAIFRPRSDAASTIVVSGSLGSTFGLLSFIGTDYVTFDGSPGGTMGTTIRLAFRNAYPLTSGPTVSIIENATNIRLNALQLQGGHAASSVIRIGASSGPVGNRELSFTNCEIRDDVNGMLTIPERGIFSDNSTGTGLLSNSGVTISNNNFINLPDGIIVGPNGANGRWDLLSNHFYFNRSGTVKLSEGIFIQSNDTLSLRIENNFIGGTQPSAGGSPMAETNASLALAGITVNISNSSPVASIKGNYIGNYSRSGSGHASFRGIVVDRGPVHVRENTIRDIAASSTQSIAFKGIENISDQTSQSVMLSSNLIEDITLPNITNTSAAFTGITYTNAVLNNLQAFIDSNAVRDIDYQGRGSFRGYMLTPSPVSTLPNRISRNVLEHIVVGNSLSGLFRGIYCDQGFTDLDYNRVGDSTIANDIQVAGGSIMYGIFLSNTPNSVSRIRNNLVTNVTLTNPGSSVFTGLHYYGSGLGVHEVKDNLVQQISTLSTNPTTESSGSLAYALVGISAAADGGGTLTFDGNTVQELTVATTAAANPGVVGFFVSRSNSASAATVSNNQVYKLYNHAIGAGPAPLMTGFRIHNTHDDPLYFSNNRIALSNGTSATPLNMYGIYDGVIGGVVVRTKYYHFNSVSITGSGSGRSAAFWHNSSSANIEIRNNIFQNIRTGSSSHFAIVHETGSSSGWNISLVNNNAYYSSVPASMGAWPLGTPLTFAGWQSASSGDAASVNVPAAFVDSVADLHLTPSNNCSLESAAVPIAGITTDADGDTRNPVSPDIGADEFNGLCITIVNVKAFIQGFYVGGGAMNATVDPMGYPALCDTILVRLASDVYPYTVLFEDTAYLQTDGTLEASFPAAASGNSYYLVLKHRNALETWSAAPVVVSNNMLFDFSTAAAQAYGSNQTLLEAGIYGLHSGDVNQDELIESSDYSQMENDVLQFLFGYQPTDITGDGLVESSDYALMENNLLQFIFVIKP